MGMSNAAALRNNVNVSIPAAPALPGRLFAMLTFEVLTQDFCPMAESSKIGREAHIAKLIDDTLTENGL